MSLSPRGERENLMAQYNVGYCRFNAKDWGEAASWFNRFVSAYTIKDALRADAFNRLGDIAFAQREYYKAIENYDKAISIGASGKDYARFQRAVMLGLVDKYDRKVESLIDIIGGGDSEYVDDAMYELGRTYVRHERFNEGANVLKRLVAGYPQSPYCVSALSELGLIYRNLGNDAEAIESTRMGTIDLIFAGTSGFTSFYDKAKVMDLPFLFTSAEEANEVLNSTDIGEQIFADFGDYDLVYLAEGDNGMRHVSTVKSWGQIEKADDVIGLKIRVPQSQMYTDCWSTLGATPVALALTELTTALSNGTAQAQDNATYHEVANATWDDIGYFSFINYMWMGCTMAANKTAWGKLNETTQNVLREKAKEAAQFSFDCIAEDNVTARKTMEEGGVQFCDNPDIDSFKKKLDIPAYYTRYASEAWYDQSLVDTIYNYGNK